ncbi:ThuA domain-containing protein [Arenicella xantha]|uniref:ThuA-like domain-containing protein n=1 Tax=Arenicella xantha TaxID=644221 RepID=A0A395JSJ0_9GAMM|nr:ThuA domain-containing protein [Arenicella xantha]RBP51670.1 hypothetical protein DFR28_1021102 [Arenicella xantha]
MSNAKQFKALLFTKTAGWHHESLLEGVTAVRELADKHHFEVEWHEDSTRINDENLAQFQVIIFLSTTGNILNDEQRASMEKFIQSGKGFVGIHSASDTEYNWDWYGKLIGRRFKIHPLVQSAEVSIVDREFYGLELFSDTFLWTDEWYDFEPETVPNLNYLLTVDERSYDTHSDWGDNKTGNGMGQFHPLAWYHQFDGGRSFYTALGHLPAAYLDKRFQEHLYGGIYWAATGKKPLAPLDK